MKNLINQYKNSFKHLKNNPIELCCEKLESFFFVLKFTKFLSKKILWLSNLLKKKKIIKLLNK